MSRSFRRYTARRGAFVLVAIALAVCHARSGVAAPPPGRVLDSPLKIHDLTSYFDANSLLMFVTNTGSFAFDATNLLGYNGGLYYPQGSNKTAIYAGGLWIGAKMGKGVRASAAEYAFDYAPGPMQGGTFQPDRGSFHVYKINRGDTYESNPDYRDWPFADGAPAGQDFWGNDSLDAQGRRVPLLLGGQTLWAVFNDANVSERGSDPGSHLPLGIEVQALAWGYDTTGPLGRAVFLRYKIIDKGDSTLRDAYVSLWADPDLGDPADDLVGCDTSLSLGFCYNAGPDAVYGSAPPAVGYMLLQGPRVGSPERCLPMTAFSGYASGRDPGFALAAYYYMQGLSVDGDTVISPVTGHPTTFMVSGDPVAGTGWVDENPADRRYMVSAGPFTMLPGDTQEVVAAVLVGQGVERLASITSLREGAMLARMMLDSLSARPVIAEIDLLPQTCPNVVAAFDAADVDRPHPAAAGPHGDLPVAILGTEGFDVSSIAVSSLKLEGVAPVTWRYEDASAPLEARESPCECGMAVGDGRRDLVCEFSRAAVLAALGPVNDHQTRMLVLAGRLNDGRWLAGRDCVTFLTQADRGPIVSPSRGRQRLTGSYPNPFNAATTLTYVLDQPGHVRLEMYDIIGRRVATVVDAWHEAGSYEATWNGNDGEGHAVPSGMYLARLTAAGVTSIEKIVLLK